MLTINLFVIANVKQLRTGGSFKILLPLYPDFLGRWRPKFSNFLTVFTVGLSLARFWSSFGISDGGGGFEPPNPPSPSVCHWFLWDECRNPSPFFSPGSDRPYFRNRPHTSPRR